MYEKKETKENYMIETLAVKNFKSLDEIYFDLTNEDESLKNLAIIYGENGSGKTNLIEVLNTLTMIVKGIGLLPLRYKEVHTQTNNNAVQIELTFRADEDRFRYFVSFNQFGLLREKLSEVKGIKEIPYYSNRKGNITVYPTKEGSEEYIQDEANLYREETIEKKNPNLDVALLSYIYPDFLADRIPKPWKANRYKQYPKLSKIIDFFQNRLAVDSYVFPRTLTDRETILFTAFGPNKEEDEEEVKKKVHKMEKFMNGFLPNINPDIQEVFYERTSISDDNYGESVSYEIRYKRRIGSKTIITDYFDESEGINALAGLCKSLISAMEGKLVFLDNFDQLISPLLMKQILENFASYIKGQLLIISGNTSLMDTSIDRGSFYTFDIDSDRNKEIYSLDSFDKRTYEGLSLRQAYEAGMFGGTWSIPPINFSELID